MEGICFRLPITFLHSVRSPYIPIPFLRLKRTLIGRRKLNRIGYVMIYDAQQCQTSDVYTLIHGQLVPISELSRHTVYEDSQYIAYNVTDYFFTNIDSHILAFQSWRTDLFFNDDVYDRIRNVYGYIQKVQPHLYNE